MLFRYLTYKNFIKLHVEILSGCIHLQKSLKKIFEPCIEGSCSTYCESKVASDDSVLTDLFKDDAPIIAWYGNRCSINCNYWPVGITLGFYCHITNVNLNRSLTPVSWLAIFVILWEKERKGSHFLLDVLLHSQLFIKIIC